MAACPGTSMLVACTGSNAELNDALEADLLPHHVSPGRMRDRLAIIVLANIQVGVKMHHREIGMESRRRSNHRQTSGVLATVCQHESLREGFCRGGLNPSQALVQRQSGKLYIAEIANRSIRQIGVQDRAIVLE